MLDLNECWRVVKGNCSILNLTSCTVSVHTSPNSHLVKEQILSHRSSLKHTCPFSPTYLIAVGTLINSHAVHHLRCPNPDTLMILDRQHCLCQYFPHKVQGSLTFTRLDHNLPKHLSSTTNKLSGERAAEYYLILSVGVLNMILFRHQQHTARTKNIKRDKGQSWLQ